MMVTLLVLLNSWQHVIDATYELKNDDEIQIHSILRKKRRNKEVALMAIGKMMMH